MECQAAFKKLKHLNLNTQTEASDVAVGAILLQQNKQENLQPCAYTVRDWMEMGSLRKGDLDHALGTINMEALPWRK